MSNITSILLICLMLGGLMAAAMVLKRYRDRLSAAFVSGPITIKGSAHLGDGSRLVLVDIEGRKALCGVGRNGIGAITLLDADPQKSEA